VLQLGPSLMERVKGLDLILTNIYQNKLKVKRLKVNMVNHLNLT